MEGISYIDARSQSSKESNRKSNEGVLALDVGGLLAEIVVGKQVGAGIPSSIPIEPLSAGVFFVLCRTFGKLSPEVLIVSNFLTSR